MTKVTKFAHTIWLIFHTHFNSLYILNNTAQNRPQKDPLEEIISVLLMILNILFNAQRSHSFSKTRQEILQGVERQTERQQTSVHYIAPRFLYLPLPSPSLIRALECATKTEALVGGINKFFQKRQQNESEYTQKYLRLGMRLH